VDALADPQVRARLAQAGQNIVPREQQTPGALATHHKAEIEKWWADQSGRQASSRSERCGTLPCGPRRRFARLAKNARAPEQQ